LLLIDGTQCGEFKGNTSQIENGPMQLILDMMIDNNGMYSYVTPSEERLWHALRAGSSVSHFVVCRPSLQRCVPRNLLLRRRIAGALSPCLPRSGTSVSEVSERRE
jgi:hypothetical protein